MAQEEQKSINQLNEEADIAADYLEGLLDIADYDGDIEMGIRNNRPMIQIVADDDEDIRHLIGRNGEVVDALQQLSRLAVQQKTGDRSHLIVDVDGFLKRKRQRLRDIALDAVDDVRETGEAVNLKPMNSFERKIIHDTVREEGLRSRSHGEEPHRYVTVYMSANAVDNLDDDVDDVDDVDVDDIDVVDDADMNVDDLYDERDVDDDDVDDVDDDYADDEDDSDDSDDSDLEDAEDADYDADSDSIDDER